MKRFRSLLWLLVAFLLANTEAAAQSNTQTVSGTVIDKASERPLANVTVQLAGTNTATRTDSSGRYVLKNVPLGRQQLSFTSVGYKTITIPEILVTVGKQVVLDIPMDQQISALNEVTITGRRVRKGMASNEFAGSSARSFSMEEVTRYAGGRNDPSRLVSNFAGVATTNDSRNDIVVRGNSPTAVLWRMEGIPIPNPNHFAALGTTGGPVSALNTNALKTSDFYTGAFSAEYGNATGAVFDLSLRTGNKDKTEKTLQLNLFSGLEAMIEGPLSKKKNGSSYLVGYRYSFAQIGQSMGFNVGTDAVPKYQDVVFNFNFAPSKLGKFNLFGMAGISSIDFIGKDLDSTDFWANTDEDTYFKSRMAIVGLKHTLDLGTKSYLRSVVSYSYTNTEGDLYKYPEKQADRIHTANQSSTDNQFRISTYLNSKLSSRFTIRGGLLAEVESLDTYRDSREETPDWRRLRDYNGSAVLFQPYVQGRFRFSEKLALNAGVHGIYYGLNQTSAIEPRASLSYAIDGTKTITFSYGLHSQEQPLPVYLFQQKKADGSYDQSNLDLDLTKAHHYVLGYDWNFAKDWRLKAEAYYQSIFDAPVEATPSGFSILNAGADFTFPDKAGLVSKGTGTNVGLELTIEKFFSRGYYLLTTASLFDARYKGSDGIERNSTFNNKLVANVLAGKEWKIGKTGKNAFTADLKLTSAGGRYYTPVDLEVSRLAGVEKLDERNFNAQRFSDYFRADVRVGFRLNNTKRKISQTIYLDLQNVSNRDNVFTQRYNRAQNRVGQVNQIGFFPDILYRIQF
ncbi:TonB-dependent receptor [Pseudoflavitalea sp. G-6-1-2]|uniref:TonB-dependent receptor n=1 Tax=Pseudoflavitalea sp. G-6-1-2 TaxID=2728841 RepID=UPI00146BBB41|nr:TonB-dependent receptor [Pseudoflavitalea sp. G-6-1-2]NML23938.1 TonB-dependent receptor [Pseudoflavitalea sp. G-6-1-2]